MKKIISVLVMLVWLISPGMAQMRQQQQRQGGGIEAMKIAFITKRLDLTPEEAERFWPVYNKYAAEVRQAYLVYRDHPNELELDESLLNIKKKYSAEFSRALPPDKINLFFRAERDFGGFVQKEMQRRQMQRRPYAGGQ